MSQAEKFFFLKRRQRVKNPPNRCGSSKGEFFLSFSLSLSAVVAVVFEQRTTAEKWHLPPFPPPSEPDAQFFRRVGEANSFPPFLLFDVGIKTCLLAVSADLDWFSSPLSTCDDDGGGRGVEKKKEENRSDSSSRGTIKTRRSGKKERKKCVEGRGRGVNSGGDGEEQCLLAIFMLSLF